MERYYPEAVKFRVIKEICVLAKKSELQSKNDPDNSIKKYFISSQRKYAFLYIDDLNDVGKGKERVVRGTVTDIVDKSRYDIAYTNCADSLASTSRTPIAVNPTKTVGNTFLIVDASKQFESKVEEIKVENILDVQPVDYDYNLEENPKLVPNYDFDLDFYEPERWHELVSRTNEPVKEYNRDLEGTRLITKTSI